MRFFAAVSFSLSLAVAVPSQGRLAFPSPIDPCEFNAYEFRGQPNTFAVMVMALAPGSSVVTLGSGIQCHLGVPANFVVVPLGLTDAGGRLAGVVQLPCHPVLVMQVVEYLLPPAGAQLLPSNAVLYYFPGCWGGGAGIGG